jgi:phage head maturation protease
MKETRSFKIEPLKEDSRTIEGYAIVFNAESRDLGGFTE